MAEQVEKKAYTVRYAVVNAMLLNEFLKEHRKIEQQVWKEQELEATVALQQKEIAVLTASLKAQASKIEKASDLLKVSEAARVVVNDQ